MIVSKNNLSDYYYITTKVKHILYKLNPYLFLFLFSQKLLLIFLKRTSLRKNITVISTYIIILYVNFDFQRFILVKIFFS